MDVSRGMSGFIRNQAGESEDMIFADVVAAAQRAYSIVREDHSLSVGAGGDVYALVESQLYEFRNVSEALKVCKNALAENSAIAAQKCIRSVKNGQRQDVLAFNAGSDVKAFLGGLQSPLARSYGPLDRKALEERDLVVLVTDLQNESKENEGAGELGELLAMLLKTPGIVVAAMSFRSHFSGWIFDLPNIKGGLLHREGAQPFFIIAVGGATLVDALVARITDELRKFKSGLALPMLITGGRAQPAIRVVAAEPPIHIEVVEPEVLPATSTLRSRRHMMDATSKEYSVPSVGIDAAEFASAGTDIHVATLQLARLPVPGSTDFVRYCWQLPGGSTFCPGSTASSVDVPLQVWLSRRPVVDLLELFVNLVKSAWGGNDKRKTLCESVEWITKGGMQGSSGDSERSPFYASVSMGPSDDGAALTLDVRIMLDWNHISELRLLDDWLVEVTVAVKSQSHPNELPWLATGQGWHVEPTEVQPGLMPPIGVGGLRQFFGRLRANVEPAEPVKLTFSRSLFISVEH